ncbi:MAG TPA: hypothetical protein DHV08_16470 [Rhodocyclaceae bacterium]|nr:MAG: hypothetical protein AUK49_07915 [Betaproteobacteria bacterium CG2_30_68_42]PIV76866.1 MAG: hypothetical protein COW56_00725 [Rhodocyclales bacterium CG17_big_fil_post_rev_8_21_14_2_50_68_7]PJA56770.1 MAG: hypothetical protein CO164_11340 [Rhodocyclales bacterium CG_4_9_14_3_um_filter_68_10]HCX34977.1 hypothetical protein [Rhodocyclaceae bacterium]
MLTRIYAAQSCPEAEIVISLLRVDGLHPLDLERSPNVCLAGADLWYYVRIPTDEVEAARNILRSTGFERGLA